ncbi:MAG: mechanosensitive ion channel family protein [Thermoplasmata archaeon]
MLVIAYGLISSFKILRLSDRDIGRIFEAYAIFLIAILTFIAYKVFKEVLVYTGRRWTSRTSAEVGEVLIPVMDKIGGIVILIFGAIGIVNYLGYDITFLLAGVGVLGLVIAFEAQDALSNLFSGVFLLLDRPFTEGDYIRIPTGELCGVEKIGIRSTRLYEVFQNDYIILPNNKLTNDKITNLDEPDEQGISEIAVGVVYGTDLDKVETILTEIARGHPDVLKEEGKKPVVRFTNFGDSSLEFKLFLWVDSFLSKWKVPHELRKEINKRFAQEGIEIAQRTVYIRKARKK